MSIRRSGGGAERAINIVFATLVVAIVWVLFNGISGVAHAQQAPAASGDVPPGGQLQLLASDQPAPIIQAIQVRGNQRIEADTVGSYLPIQPGMPAEPEFLDITLKTLFNTGLFSDVKLEMQPNGALLIEVEENPIVNQVIVEGNKRLKDDKISEEIQLTPRSVYTRSKVQADVQRLIELYRAKGRFAATVTPKVVPLEQNRIDVVFEIDEGPRTGVAKVNFVGNEVFTDGELRGAILTKESRWWRFFTSNDNYDPDRLEYERELLRQFYGRNGYADFQVVSAVAELTPDRKDFFITFTVDEGPKYTIGEVRVKTTLAKLDNSLLEAFVPIKSGQTFDSERVEKSVESITFATGASGYAFVDVNPRLRRHEDSKTVDITFEVNEGPRVYVERINISGNVRTLDKVIRREVRLAEGDPFNRVLMDRSKARVQSLGYFSEVEIEEKPGSAPDRTELDVTVEEQSTGSFSVGVGVSSTESFIVDLSIEERNLMGRGQFLRFRVQASARTRQVDLRFTQPYFLDRNMSAGGSIFNQRTNFREAGFVRDRYGAGLNTGFQVSEFGRVGLNYLFTRDNINLDNGNRFNQRSRTIPLTEDPLSLFVPGAMPSDTISVDGNGVQLVDANGDPVQVVQGFLCDFVQTSLTPTCLDRGSFTTSLLGASLSFNRLDNPFQPNRGWRTSMSVGFAGLGGDVNYYQGEIDFAYYKPIIGELTLALKGRAGYIDGYGGDDVRLANRFFEGAATFRGFEVAGVGPRFIQGQGPFDINDPSIGQLPFRDRRGRINGQALGGKAYAIGSFELLIPLPLPDEYGIRAALFTDFGSVGLIDESLKQINDLQEARIAFIDENGDFQTFLPVQDDFALRVTAGVSVSWDSPFGPVRFDFAEIIRKEFYDQTEVFRFSAGTNF